VDTRQTPAREVLRILCGRRILRGAWSLDPLQAGPLA